MIQTKLMYDPSVLEEDFRKDLEYFHEYMVKRGAAANTISSYACCSSAVCQRQ